MLKKKEKRKKKKKKEGGEEIKYLNIWLLSPLAVWLC